MATVRTGARLHLGFQNLSLAHERLYGGVGLGLADPEIEVTAQPAEQVMCDDPAVADYVARAVEVLSVEGANVEVRSRFERHVGLGSGTQLALACLVAIARAHDRSVDVRDLAPAMGRGGRSGVGVATFEHGGFVVDAGHPTGRFTAAPPARGEWSVPPAITTHAVPEHWRFLLIRPTAEAGPSGPPEETQLRAAIERADPAIADEIATLLTRELLPAIAERDAATFGAAAARLGRLNGAWYADEQGGVYRPPAGRVIEALDDVGGITGAGQSSWGPTVYAITQVDKVDAAAEAAKDAIAAAGLEADVRSVAPRNTGASIDE
ncbi:MAG: beta-ribofuranosylaminobenzene 5'-phosphate synthase family protein [Salinirussus sp.]